MASHPDDTVILPVRRRRRRWPFATAGAMVALVLAGAGSAWMRSPVPVAPIPLATEAELRDEAPTTLTVLRFAANPAVVVLDFPTLAEQGRMLNRVAAWAEKLGQPHDRLLSDAELDAAIRASGTTAETYYYGHDYRGADILRFFAIAQRDHVPLRPDEERLHMIAAQAGAGAEGFGALITLPRADAANDVDPAARAAILHHELSHGQYFTDPAYAAFVATIWTHVLTADEQAAFRTYLTSEGYDPALEDLMMNETQAYLMHTPDPRFFDPARLGIPPTRLAQIRQAFVAGMPPGWLRRATPGGAPRWRRAQRLARVSSTRALAATLPPRRRRASMAA